MNQEQIMKLNGLHQNLLSAFDMDSLTKCYETLLEILKEEEEYYKNIPCDLKESPQAKESERVIELLNRADDALLDAAFLYEEFEILYKGNKNDFRKKASDAIDCVVEVLRQYIKQ